MRLCLVVRALDRTRHITCTDRQVDPDRVVAREPLQAPGEEWLEDEVPPVLLADDDHDRRTVHARRCDRTDGVPEPRRRVQNRERRRAAADRVARRHRDDRSLVQSEHKLEFTRKIGEERDLGRAGVREQLGEPTPTEDVERGVPDGPRCQPQTSSATSTISLSFAH